MREGSRTALLFSGLLLAGLTWMLVREVHFSAWIDDDAFITLRYARNWAQGNGLVFNPGEFVEGYTNFLWTAFMAIASKLGIDLPTAAQVLGGSFSVLTVLLLLDFRNTGLLQRQEHAASSGIILAPLALCFSDSWAAWAVGGLENVFSGFLVAAGFLLYFRFLAKPSQAVRWLTLCAAVLCLAIMNHPTNILFAAVISLHLLWEIRQQRAPRTAWVLFFLIGAVVLGVFMAARFAYYGDILPNTFYAKGGMSLAVWQRGLKYFLHVLAAHPLPYVTTVAFAVLLLRKMRNVPLALLVVAILLYSMYIIAVGGEEFPAYRSLIVLLPLFALQLPVLFSVLRRRTSWRPLLAAAFAALLLLLFASPLYWNERVRRLDTAIAEGRTALSRTAALMLKSQLPPNTLFAHSGAGLIAFYTDFPWIDTLGLCDHHIARTNVETLGEGAAGHEKGDGQYVWSRQPDFVMFPGYPISNRLPGTKSDKELWAIPEFHQRYRPLRVGFTFQSSLDAQPRQHSLFLYQRIDP